MCTHHISTNCLKTVKEPYTSVTKTYKYLQSTWEQLQCTHVPAGTNTRFWCTYIQITGCKSTTTALTAADDRWCMVPVVTSIRHTQMMGLCSTVLLQLTVLPHSEIIETTVSKLFPFLFYFYLQKKSTAEVNRCLNDARVLVYKPFVLTRGSLTSQKCTISGVQTQSLSQLWVKLALTQVSLKNLSRPADAIDKNDRSSKDVMPPANTQTSKKETNNSPFNGSTI